MIKGILYITYIQKTQPIIKEIKYEIHIKYTIK